MSKNRRKNKINNSKQSSRSNKENTDVSSDLSCLLSNQKYAYDLVNSWISNVESKITVATSVTLGLFSVITYLSEKCNMGHYSYPSLFVNVLQYIYSACLILGFVFLVFSICMYFFAINPNLKSNNKNSLKKYPIYFGDIEKQDLNKYKNNIVNSTDKDTLDELIDETHFNACLCLRKMKKFKIGFVFSFVSVLLAIIGLIISYVLSSWFFSL